MQFKHSKFTLATVLVSALALGACNTGEASNPLPGESDSSHQTDGELLDDAALAADVSVTADTAAQEDTVTPEDATVLTDSSLPEDATDPEDTAPLTDTAASEDASAPEDTAPGDAEPEGLGFTPDSCGSVDQGLTPIDCTQYGDTGADCVFSNHCSCSTNDGFVCEGWKEGDGSECSPGIYCVPLAAPVPPESIGNVPTSCGSPDPIDCTQYGDSKAICVFGHHCMCSVENGFTCATPGEFGGDKECDPGVYCMPTD
jgi:hypothetical protein